jgi:hypothetical protein
MTTAALSDAEAIAILLPHLENVRKSGHQVACLCPLHLTAHPRGRPFSLDCRTGRCHCWSRKCGWTGNAQMLVRELGITPDDRPGRTVDWGLPLKQFGIVVKDYGAHFPVFDHEGNRCRDHVRRHQGEPRFYFAKGEGRVYRALVDWKHAREWDLVYLVEGNRDWLTLASHGYAAVGLLGVEHFQKAREEVFPHLRAAGIGAVVIVPDRDDVGREAAREWAWSLLRDGYTVGIKPLPASAGDKSVKDTYDLYAALGDRFGSHFDSPAVTWRAP